MDYDAIVLAGGHGARLGGVDKARIELAGAPLISRPLAACAGARRVVVVGPDSLHGLIDPLLPQASSEPSRLLVTRESPPGSGPAAATAAGLRTLAGASAAGWVLLLSCDLPLAVHGVRRLLHAATTDADAAANANTDDGYCLASSDGQLQWLFAIYRRAALSAAVERLDDPAGSSMRHLLSGLRLTAVPGSAHLARDLDTWEDHAEWTARLCANQVSPKGQA